MFNESRVFAHSLFIEFKTKVWGITPSVWRLRVKQSILSHVSAEILPENLRNLFIIVRLVLKCSILAIIFEYFLSDPSVKRWPKLSRGLKNFRGAQAHCPYFPRLWAPFGRDTYTTIL